MTFDESAHHLRLSGRAERGAALLGLFDGDEAIDDLTALHQKGMHRLIDAVDFAPQIRKRCRAGTGRFSHGVRECAAAKRAALIGATARESKENIDTGGLRPI